MHMFIVLPYVNIFKEGCTEHNVVRYYACPHKIQVGPCWCPFLNGRYMNSPLYGSRAPNFTKYFTSSLQASIWEFKMHHCMLIVVVCNLPYTTWVNTVNSVTINLDTWTKVSRFQVLVWLIVLFPQKCLFLTKCLGQCSLSVLLYHLEHCLNMLNTDLMVKLFIFTKPYFAFID